MRRLALTLFAALSLPLSSTPMRSDPYTPDALLAELQGDFEPWVAARKGQLCLARDPWHFLELLAESPAGWRTVLHWDGEANPGDVPEAGDFCVQRLSLGVTANLGLTAKPDQSLVKATAARPARGFSTQGMEESGRDSVPSAFHRRPRYSANTRADWYRTRRGWIHLHKKHRTLRDTKCDVCHCQ